MDYQQALKSLQPGHDFFIGIDSDGCVFDSMEVKQKEFFIPNALKHFDLYDISDILRETWEFVNLYSVYRGGNRFTSLLKVFELLNENGRLKNMGYKLPDMSALKAWVKIETKLGNTALQKYFEANYDPVLEMVLRWSESINEEIGRLLRKIPPFPHAIKAIEEISGFADIVIVSQTPLEALDREWQENDLKKFVRIIAGQEHGTKSEHLALAAKGKYPDNRILMIGDAMGDLYAAKNNNIHFFPVIPGREDQSWYNFINQGLTKFRDNKYKGEFEERLHNEFRKYLPDTMNKGITKI